MKTDTSNKQDDTQNDGAIWRCFNRLVRWCGFEVCWLGMMGMILVANTKSAGFDALLVAVFAWLLGYGTGKFFLKPNTEPTLSRGSDGGQL